MQNNWLTLASKEVTTLSFGWLRRISNMFIAVILKVIIGHIFMISCSSGNVHLRVDHEYLHAATTLTLTCRSDQTNGVLFRKDNDHIGLCAGSRNICSWTNKEDFHLSSNYSERTFYMTANISDDGLCTSFSCTDGLDANAMDSVFLYKAFDGNATIFGDATHVAVVMNCVVPSRIFNITWYYKQKGKNERILYQPFVSNSTVPCDEQCHGEIITSFTQSFEPPVSSDPINAITVLFEVDIVFGGFSGIISRTLSQEYYMSGPFSTSPTITTTIIPNSTTTSEPKTPSLEFNRGFLFVALGVGCVVVVVLAIIGVVCCYKRNQAVTLKTQQATTENHEIK